MLVKIDITEDRQETQAAAFSTKSDTQMKEAHFSVVKLFYLAMRLLLPH